MATNIWQSTDGDVNAAGSWSDGIPTANDDCFISGSQAATTNMAALTAIDLDSFQILPDYTAAWGGSGNQFQISCGSVIHRGAATSQLWWLDGGGLTDHMLIDCPNMTNAANVDGTSVTRLTCIRGKTTIAGSAALMARLEIGYQTNRSGDAVVVATAGGGGITLLNQDAGKFTSDVAITTANVSGGKLIQDTAAITTLNLTGGTVDYRHSALTTVEVHDGAILDMTNVTVPTTVTTVYVYPGGKVFADTNIVTFTNQFKIGSGEIVYSPFGSGPSQQ